MAFSARRWSPSPSDTTAVPWVAPAEGATQDGGYRALGRSLSGSLGVVSGLMPLVCGGVLCFRRLSGALATFPSAGELLVVTAAGVGLALASDRVAQQGSLAPLAARAGLMLALASLVPATLGQGLDRAVLLACLLMALAVTLAPLRTHLRFRATSLRNIPAGSPATGRQRAPRVSETEHTQQPIVPGNTREESCDAVAPTATAPAQTLVEPLLAPAFALTDQTTGRLVQRLERYQGHHAGSDTLRGTVNLFMAAGARTAHGHIGFCPPFAHIPAVEVTTAYEAVEAVVSAAEILPWGVRVECRLDAPADEAFEIPVDIQARC